MRRALVLLFLLSLAPVWACPSAAMNPEPLAGSEWLVLEIGELQAAGEAYIQFQSEGKVAGLGGVNQFGGTYEVREAGLTFGPLVMTRMAGAPELMELESRLTEALEKVTGFERDGIHMKLLIDGQPAVTLRQRDAD